ncbi:MAG: flagellar M-ring protein FliF, partial [Myxococcales bacterium]
MAMIGGAQAQQILDNLSALGARKLGAMAIIGLLVVAVVGLGAYYLSRPDMEVLYTGLDRQDVSRIGSELTEAGIAFDINAAGDSVSTPFSQTAGARMLLAEKGLPRSENAGYELFDQMGSMGLTSFMQEVTRVRALEGELARTVQTLKDVRAARVHIVLPEAGSFRRDTQKPSASVVIRTDGGGDFGSAQAIRHLVASAIPGMDVDEVTVLN